MSTSIKVIESTNKIDAILNRDFISRLCTGHVEIGEEKFCWMKGFVDFEERIRKLEVRDDDVILAAYPKSGTTWANEMIWMIVNNLDYEKGKEIIQKRSPLLEFSSIFDSSVRKSVDIYDIDSMTYIDNLKSPRCFKTHMPWSLLPEQIKNGTKKPKIITVLRNPQDVCLSLYHHDKLVETYKGNVDDFCEVFLAGRVPPGPFWKFVLGYWEQRHNSNIHFIKYRDMKSDLPSVIKGIAKFLEKPITDEAVEKLAEHLGFHAMKENPAVNYKQIAEQLTQKSSEEKHFIRSGKEGGFKSVMPSELIIRFENWTRENISGANMDVSWIN